MRSERFDRSPIQKARADSQIKQFEDSRTAAHAKSRKEIKRKGTPSRNTDGLRPSNSIPMAP